MNSIAITYLFRNLKRKPNWLKYCKIAFLHLTDSSEIIICYPLIDFIIGFRMEKNEAFETRKQFD